MALRASLIEGNYKFTADTGLLGTDSQLMVISIKDPRTNDERNFNAVHGYIRGVSENGILALERTFPIMSKPAQHQSWVSNSL